MNIELYSRLDFARRRLGTEPMEIREAGLIAGDGLYGFFSALAKTFF
ncbi:hypothetical protein [Tepidanaerobacter acetatoxydans]|nr:hypothetical protein [Tepidanaerobacter acetatoxydans]